MYPGRDGTADLVPTPVGFQPPWAGDAAERRQGLAPLPQPSPGCTNQTCSAQAFFSTSKPLRSSPPPSSPTTASRLPLRSRRCRSPRHRAGRCLWRWPKGVRARRGVRGSAGLSPSELHPGGARGRQRGGSWGAGTRGFSWAMSLSATEGASPLAPPAATALPAPVPSSGRKETPQIFLVVAQSRSPPQPLGRQPPWMQRADPGRAFAVRTSNPSSWSTVRLWSTLLPRPAPALLRAEEPTLVGPAVPRDTVCGGSGAGVGWQHGPAAGPRRGRGCKRRSPTLCQCSSRRPEGAEVTGGFCFDLACWEGERSHRAHAGNAAPSRVGSPQTSPPFL